MPRPSGKGSIGIFKRLTITREVGRKRLLALRNQSVSYASALPARSMKNEAISPHPIISRFLLESLISGYPETFLSASLSSKKRMDTHVCFQLCPSLVCLPAARGPGDQNDVETKQPRGRSELPSEGVRCSARRSLLCPAMPGLTWKVCPVCAHILASVVLMNEGGQEGADTGGAKECVCGQGPLYN